MPEDNRLNPSPEKTSIWKDLWEVVKIISVGAMWLILMVLTYYSMLTIPIFLVVVGAGVMIYRAIRERNRQKKYRFYDPEEQTPTEKMK